MSANFSLPRQLVKGDKRVVTIEDFVSDCIVVSLIYQNRKYCGALMDISKRKGPYGIPQNDTVKKDESKSIKQGTTKTPFPQPLLTRQTFQLGVSQPPLRVFRKLRKGRRKVYCDSLELDENAFQDQTMKSSSFTDITSSSNPLKRKADDILSDNKINAKLRIVSNKSKVQNKPKILSKSLASPFKHLIPQETYSYDTSCEDNFSVKVLHVKTDLKATQQDDTVGKAFVETQPTFKKRQVGKRTGIRKSAFGIRKMMSEKKKAKRSSHKEKLIANADVKKSTSRKRKPCSKFKTDFITFSDADDFSLPVMDNDKVSKNSIKTPKEFVDSCNSSAKESLPLISNLTDEKTEPEVKMKKQSQKCNTESHVIYVTKCKSVAGVTFTQGDVVWSKLKGYPWWPSTIVKLIVTKTDGKCLQQEAMVAWYRCKTTSILPLESIQLFNENFEIRFEKKRKGVYRKAVNDAQLAAKKITREVRKLRSQFET